MGLMVMQDMPSMTNEFYNPNNDPDVPKPQNTITVSAVQDCIRLEQNRTREIIWDVDQAEFDRQLAVMIEQHKSYPSIIAWVSESLRITH
jgi:beta-galactosidase/beta-glucuronidase